MQLHCMSDALACGYRQCLYLRLQDERCKVRLFCYGKGTSDAKNDCHYSKVTVSCGLSLCYDW